MTAVLYPEGTPIEVDADRIRAMGIQLVLAVPSVPALLSPMGGSGAWGGDGRQLAGSVDGDDSPSASGHEGAGSVAAAGTAGVHYDPEALVAAVRHVLELAPSACRLEQQQQQSSR